MAPADGINPMFADLQDFLEDGRYDDAAILMAQIMEEVKPGTSHEDAEAFADTLVGEFS